MKRSQIKPNPDKVREWMARSRAKAAANAQAKPRKPLAPAKRKSKAHVPQAKRAAALARTGGLCVAPGCTRRAEHLHHVLEERNFPAYALEARNLVGVCAGCHDEHERAHRRLPWGALPPEVRKWAAEVALKDGRAARALAVNYGRPD